MSPTHHLTDATLLAYGSGSLTEGPALVVASHLIACPECLHKVDVVETVGGILLDGLPPAPMAANSLSKALMRLDSPPELSIEGTDTKPELGWLPEPLRRYRLGRWRWVAPGIRQIVVVPRTRGGSSARLLRLAPQTSLPSHEHSSLELACVLLGSFSDERGQFAAGDVSEVDETVRHRPVSNPDEECICLLATTGPLRFQGPIGWLIQVFLGF